MEAFREACGQGVCVIIIFRLGAANFLAKRDASRISRHLEVKKWMR